MLAISAPVPHPGDGQRDDEDDKSHHHCGADEFQRQARIVWAEVFVDVFYSTNRFVPLDDEWQRPAGAFAVHDRNVRYVEELMSCLMDPQTEVDIFEMQEVVLIHTAQS